MAKVFLGLGSNLGDRRKFLLTAIEEIGAISKIRMISSLYETEPVGNTDQPRFLNMVMEIETDIPPLALLARVKEMEARLGRKNREHMMPREIDIDILFYGDAVLTEGGLHVPHPEMNRRRFVLEPLKEIAADAIDPRSGKTVADLLEECPDSSSVLRTMDSLAGRTSTPNAFVA